MTTNQLTGFTTEYVGLLRNVRASERSNQDNTKRWTEHYMDMEHLSQEGKPILTEFRISKAALDAGMFSKLQGLTGSVIRFDVYSQERVYKDRIYKTYYFTGKDLPATVDTPSRQPQQSTAKAG